MTLNSIIANFQTFKLADLLDIVIIAFLIYQLLGIINRTRAGQLAKGALLVLAVYLVANVLNMRHLAAELAAAGRPADAGGPVPAGDPPRIGADGPDRPVGGQALQHQGPLQ